MAPFCSRCSTLLTLLLKGLSRLTYRPTRLDTDEESGLVHVGDLMTYCLCDPDDTCGKAGGGGGCSSSRFAPPPSAGPKPLEEPKKKMRSMATWTVVSGMGAVGYASDAQWGDQYRPSLGANPCEVKSPFRGLSLADQDNEPPAVNAAEEEMSICPVRHVLVMCEEAHTRGKLHTGREQTKRDALTVAATAAGDTQAALELPQKDRPELLTPAPVLMPTSAGTPAAGAVRASPDCRVIRPLTGGLVGHLARRAYTWTPSSPSLIDVNLDFFLATSGSEK
ncbi:hypothetical protein HPB47_010012 [Ixodes persulcatus]|uniref:Uncharacterized protein n=1 Tax=Ixodes persulcatus TaxID=34615 RepID=A0AC60P0I9_IXOPE|nr:hypothetical protein HPB47_010012 [Ixodes persulcatus]